MAAPITHLVFASKTHQKHFAHLDRDAFFIGTTFPDIRYLGVIDRKKTHLEHMPFFRISRTDAFRAGFQLHTFLDIERERFFSDCGISELFPQTPEAIQALKLYEDELIYDQMEDWEKIVTFFDTIHPQELTKGISEQDVKEWHEIIQGYISQKPNEEVRAELIERMISPDAAEAIESHIKNMRRNLELRAMLELFLKQAFAPEQREGKRK